MTIHDRPSRVPCWLRVLNATLKFVITAQVAFLLFVGGIILVNGLGIVGLAANG